jgi:hypothetical protein
MKKSFHFQRVGRYCESSQLVCDHSSQYLTDSFRASPTPLYGDVRAYYLFGTFWTTPAGGTPSCTTYTDPETKSKDLSSLPYRPPYDIASVGLGSLFYGTGSMPGFPKVYSNISYIAQCTGATMKGVPYVLRKASFLTVTQTVSNSDAAQTPAPAAESSAPPEKTLEQLSVGPSALPEKEKGSAPVAPAPSVPPAPSSTNVEPGIQAPAPSASPASSPSQEASAPNPQSEEALPESAPAVVASNLQSLVPQTNGAPAAPAATGQSGNPAASARLSSERPAEVAPFQPPPPIIPLPGKTLTGNSASQYIAGTQTLIPGGPAISISGMVVSLAPSATAIVLGGSSTMNIVPPSAYQAPQPPVITLAGTTLTANSASQYVVDSQTLLPGGPTITVSGTAVALAPSATAIIFAGSSTISLAPLSTPSEHNALGPSMFATPTEIPIIVIDGQTLTLTPDSSTTDTITVENVPVQVSGSYVIYGNSAIPISGVATAVPNVSVYTSEASAMVIGSQTLIQGGSAVTLEAGAGTTRIVSWVQPMRA